MKNYMHVKIFILWTLVISKLANESQNFIPKSKSNTNV
jgi:hypothetical protein